MQGVAMKHVIETTTEGLRIKVSVGDDKRDALLQEFAKCAAGTCSCGAPQYDKVKSIEVKAQPAGVIVELHAKPGRGIDVVAIHQCLEHTAQQIGE
jgi:hypothetical protein